MCPTERFYVQGEDPVRVEIVNPACSPDVLEGLGATAIDFPVVGNVGFYMSACAFAAFEKDSQPDIVADERPKSKSS